MVIFKDYLNFFVRCAAERYVHLQGGRRSGKTINTFLWLRMLGYARQCPLTIMVCDSTAPALKNTISDFTLATGLTPKSSIINGINAQDGNILWKFVSFDDFTKTQGVRCDYLFVNEAVRVPMAILEVLVQGVVNQIYFNFNPTKKSGIERWISDTNIMYSTFKNNPTLSAEQVAEFENIRVRAGKANATKRDLYLYQVYYLGQFSDISGQIFDNVYRITDEEYRNIPVLEIFGMDFGFASSSSADPTTLIGVKLYENKIYCKQYIYENGIVNDATLAHKMAACGLDYTRMIFADYGGMGNERIKKLVSADNGKWTDLDIRTGFQIFNAQKTTVYDGVMEMLSTDGLYVTEESVELHDELQGYELDEHQKFIGADHGIDALRYAFHYYKNYLQ